MIFITASSVYLSGRNCSIRIVSMVLRFALSFSFQVFMLKGFVLPLNSIGSIYRTQKAMLFECPHPPLIKTKWEKKCNIFTEILYTITNMWLTAQQVRVTSVIEINDL